MTQNTAAVGPVGSVIARLDALTEQDPLDLDMIVGAFGATGFVPVLMVLALIVISPLSGIPFLPTVLGLMVALVASQMLARRPRLWLPKMLLRRRVSGAMLHGGLGRLRRWGDWMDARARHRLRALVVPPLDALPKACCMACGLAMPLLELVPFSSSLLGVSILLFSTGLLTRDGLFPVLGAIVMGGAALIPIGLYGGILFAARPG